MRVAIIAESFLPSLNGVTNSVLRVLEHLRATGHEAMVIAPAIGDKVPKSYLGFPVETVHSIGMPFYEDVRAVTTTNRHVARLLTDFRPDVLHLAAPFVLGYKAATVAKKLGIPSVAIYQTDLPNFATQYGFGRFEPLMWRHVRRVHSLANITYAPSTFARDQLIRHGVPRVGVWARGVDSVRFDPAKRDAELRSTWAPNGEKLIGYVGRLAAEKRVNDLTVLSDIPGTRLVVIGDGPLRDQLRERLPGAVFTGQLTGEDLPRSMASLDLFVHPGQLETFGQAMQEAKASGLAVVAPRRGGPIDLVSPSRTGWLYEPGDLAAFRGFVVDLIGDDAKRKAFGATARESTLDRTWERICAEIVEHYEQTILMSVRGDALAA